MGYIRHDAIVLTSWNKEGIASAHQKAKELGLPVTDVTDVVINGYVSFLIAPDGSKEGWSESDVGDKARDEFKKWIKDPAQETLWIDWVHINYGGDEPNETCIMDHNTVD